MTRARAADFVGVVVAAGGSTRFGGKLPKQFLPLGNETVLARAVASLAERPAVRGVVVVLPPGRRDGRDAAGAGVLAAVPGGATRADSVRAGLDAVGSAPFVLVHDAARPLAGPALVDAVIDATRRHGAAVPGLAVADTVKRVERGPGGALWVGETVDRQALRLAQTPQGARTEWLRRALDRAAREGTEVTDEAAALEGDGRRVAVVAGDPANRKITTAEDLEAARRSLGLPGTELRVGTGFDIHRFAEGRPLVLGGVRFPGETGLAGHSDADVVLHAAMDAVLGAAALGDIGACFPPEDPSYAGADSARLAEEVARRMRGAGYELVNLDLTLLAEGPRIRPRVDAMRRAIARSFAIAVDRVGLKATTVEGLGALGRREGIACQASVLLCRGATGRWDSTEPGP